MKINPVLSNPTSSSKRISIKKNNSNPSFQRLVIGDKGRKLAALGTSVAMAVGLSQLSILGVIISAVPTLAALLGIAYWAATAPKGADGIIDNIPDEKDDLDIKA